MKTNSEGGMEIPLEEITKFYTGDGICMACRCVVEGEDVDGLEVYVHDKEGSAYHDPVAIACVKCGDAVLESYPFLERILDERRIIPFPKKLVWLALQRNIESFRRRGMDPKKHIEFHIFKVPADHDFEAQRAAVKKKLDEMKRVAVW